LSEKRVIAGRYEVGQLLGRGGMADVYEGVDTRLGRTVAIKLLKSDLANDPAFEARFRQEAQASARMAHPTIVRIYDAGEEITQDMHGNQHKFPFIVMEFVSGKLLRDLLHERRLTIQEAIDYSAGILTALEFSHRAGVIHRDIKSANIMITPTGQVKVMDFGIARAVSDSSATMAHTSGIVGTAQYFSPEQAKGETVDHRTDLYSAGVLLYEMLAGRPPFKGETAVSVAYQHVSEPVIPASTHNPEISAELDAVVMRALAKDREQRFQSAEEFREHLLAAFTGSPTTMESPLAAVTSSVEVVEQASVAEAPAAEQTPAYTPAEDDFEALLFGSDQRTTVMPAAEVPAPVAQALVTPTPVAPPVVAPVVATPAPMPTPIAAPSDEFLDGPSTNPFKTLGVELPTVTGSTPQPVLARMNKPSKGLIWGVSSGAAVLIIGLLVWLGSFGGFNFNVNPNAGIQVADVTNQSYDNAVTTLTGQKLLVSKMTEASETVPKDFVIRTDPPAGTAVPENTTITVYVSAGKNTVLVPNLTGLTETEAVAALTTAKLVVGTITQANSPSVEAGKVISTMPAMNSQIEEGGVVNLVISDGKVEVPDVRNLSISDARSILTGVAVGFTVIIEADPNPCEGTPGTIVVDQSIEPGLATQRSEIVLTVACNQ